MRIRSTVREQTREAVSPDLDRLIHERIRLGIVSALAVNRSLTFNELKALLKTTDGNLSVHARKLEEANYIVCTKSFDGRLPKTEYRLAGSGTAGIGKILEPHGSIDPGDAARSKKTRDLKRLRSFLGFSTLLYRVVCSTYRKAGWLCDL